MDSKGELYLKRARTEMNMAFLLLKTSNNELLQHFDIPEEETQAQLHHESSFYRTHVRRTILELQDKQLVTCLNPKDRIYKLYKITKKGKGVLTKIQE